MTTIAFDGRYLAADSYVSGGGNLYGTTKKIKLMPNGKLPLDAVYALSGAHALTYEFADYLADNYPNGLKCDLDYTAIVIYCDGSIDTYHNKTSRPEDVKPTHKNHYALGSGYEYALGAMAAGATAMEAVRIASMYDLGSGGEIQVFDTKKWIFLK